MYKICKKSICIDGKNETVYGVESKEISINDVSHDLKSVKYLVKKLNSNGVSQEHLKDVIEDFIASI